MVSCCLWFPDAGGPLDTVHLTTLEPGEWSGLAGWAQSRAVELPALAALLADLPARVPPARIAALARECQWVDWDTLSGAALGGFSALSVVVAQAVSQAGAGLRFAQEAEPGAVADGGA